MSFERTALACNCFLLALTLLLAPTPSALADSMEAAKSSCLHTKVCAEGMVSHFSVSKGGISSCTCIEAQPTCEDGLFFSQKAMGCVPNATPVPSPDPTASPTSTPVPPTDHKIGCILFDYDSESAPKYVGLDLKDGVLHPSSEPELFDPVYCKEPIITTDENQKDAFSVLSTFLCPEEQPDCDTSDLEAQISSYVEQLGKAHADLKAAQERVDSLEGALDLLKKEFADSQAEGAATIEKLQEKIARLDAALAEAEQVEGELRKKVDEYGLLLKQEKASHTDTKEALAQAKQELAALQTEYQETVANYRDQLRGYREQLAELRVELDAANKARQTAETEAQRQHERADAFDKLLQELKVQLNSVHEELTEEREAHESTKAKLSKALEKHEALEGGIETMKKALKAAEEQIAIANDNAQVAKERALEVAADLTDAESRLARVQAALEGTQNELDLANQENDSLQSELKHRDQKWQSALDDAEIRIQELIEVNHGLEETIGDLKGQIAKLEAALKESQDGADLPVPQPEIPTPDPGFDNIPQCKASKLDKLKEKGIALQKKRKKAVKKSDHERIAQFTTKIRKNDTKIKYLEATCSQIRNLIRSLEQPG